MKGRTRTILVDGLGFGESPRWHDGRLWISDIALRRVLTVSFDGTIEVVCQVDGRPSGLGWLPDGRLLVVSMRDRTVIRVEHDGQVAVHADLSSLLRADPNDMVVDGHGWAYVSNPGYDATTEEPAATGIVVIEPQGNACMQSGGLLRPNGMAITPDGKTLLVAETRLHQVSAIAIGDGGELGAAREFGRLPSPSWADGVCLDAEGAAWVADPLGCRCFRLRDGGEIAEMIDTAPTPTVACVLGGPDRRTLYLCMAALRPMDDRAADPRGRVECLYVDVPGAGIP